MFLSNIFDLETITHLMKVWLLTPVVITGEKHLGPGYERDFLFFEMSTLKFD